MGAEEVCAHDTQGIFDFGKACVLLATAQPRLVIGSLAIGNKNGDSIKG